MGRRHERHQDAYRSVNRSHEALALVDVGIEREVQHHGGAFMGIRAQQTCHPAARMSVFVRAPKLLVRGSACPDLFALDDTAVDAAVLAWKTKPVKSKSDYRLKPILADAEEMVSGVVDLPRFAEIKAPITERDFAWLRLLTQALVLVGDDVVEGDASRKTLSREAEVAVEQVRAARTRLARVGVAGGVNATLLAIPASSDNPAGVLAGADRVVRQAHRVVDTFHDAAVAKALVDTLAAAADRLREIVFGAENAGTDTAEVNARRAALKRIVYDVLTRIGPWGLAAVGDDPTRERAYRLDNVFAPSTKPKAPTAAPTSPLPLAG